MKRLRGYRKIWSDHYGEIPKDEEGRTYEIHHIDGNKKNNHISNLKAVSIKEHYEIHKSQGDWAACSLLADRINITLEERLIINEKLKNKVISLEVREKISNSLKGVPLSDETKKKISEATKGKKRSEKTKQKMRKPKSDNMKKNMSEYAKNRSSQHRENLSNSNKGKALSKETKQKISNSQKDREKPSKWKIIYQYTKDGKFIKEHNSIKNAAIELKTYSSAIVHNLKLRSKTCAGFIFKYNKV